MTEFIGTKRINAKPMNRLDYNIFRGWQLPADENGSDEGYLVEYIDGGQPNTAEYAGYVSWSPKEQFENAYKASGNLSFGDATEYMKLGYKVARAGWNGKGMYLKYFSPVAHGFGDSFVVENESKPLLPFIVMKTADDMFVPWLASQTDMLANDWMVLS